MTRTIDNVHPALRPFWHPVAYSRDLGAEPIAVTLLGEQYVVVRIGDGVAAFPDRCPHRLAPLSAGCVVDDALQCAYHGYRYDRAGGCVRIPSQDPALPIPPKARLEPVGGVEERYGIVWLAPDPPVHELVTCAEFDDPGFVKLTGPLQVWNAGAAQMQDNFIDYAHFAYRHSTTFGTEAEIDISTDPEVTRDGWGFTGFHSHMIKDPEDTDPERTVQPREMHFEYVAPFTLITRVHYPSRSLITILFQTLQPETVGTTRIFGAMLRNDLGALGVREMEVPPDFEDMIAGEDRWLLEQFPSKAMPVDVTAEVHTKADRITLELRRLFADVLDRHEEGQ